MPAYGYSADDLKEFHRTGIDPHNKKKKGIAMTEYKTVSTDATELRVVEDKENYTLHLARTHNNDSQVELMGLYLVTLSRVRYHNGTKIQDHVSNHFVIAGSEEAAIGQVDERDQEYSDASAVRLPLYIRGWGHTTF